MKLYNLSGKDPQEVKKADGAYTTDTREWWFATKREADFFYAYLKKNDCEVNEPFVFDVKPGKKAIVRLLNAVTNN